MSVPEPPSPEAARSAFPRGLSQPERATGGYRFSVDALLLACFVRPPRAGRVLDLGCGCGAAGFGMLLRPGAEHLRLTGLDLDPAMLACARENAARLGLAERFEAVQADAAAPGSGMAGSFACVLANPPYRERAAGRLPPGEGRAAARFESGEGLAAFVRAAGQALAARGSAAFVFLAERLPELLALAQAAGLTPKRLRCVHGRAARPARIVLVECRKAVRPGLILEPPLILYADTPPDAPQRCAADALAFCPFLSGDARAQAGEKV